jgi:hypothetical protein
MQELDDLLTWLRATCARYEVEPVAVYRKNGSGEWPLVANDATELLKKLEDRGHFLALPKEPAALANIIEVSIVDFLLEEVAAIKGITVARGTERGYPDIEVSGPDFGGHYFAVDVKVARRKVNASGKVNPNKTQSRITLYTGNTYFRWPDLHWPGTFRPFEEYAAHLDIVVIYTLDEGSSSRITDMELIVHESWRLASKKRSSTTREYIGAVDDIERLRKGEGEFATKADFYSFWRRFSFKTGKVVEQQLRRLLAER